MVVGRGVNRPCAHPDTRPPLTHGAPMAAGGRSCDWGGAGTCLRASERDPWVALNTCHLLARPGDCKSPPLPPTHTPATSACCARLQSGRQSRAPAPPDMASSALARAARRLSASRSSGRWVGERGLAGRLGGESCGTIAPPPLHAQGPGRAAQHHHQHQREAAAAATAGGAAAAEVAQRRSAAPPPRAAAWASGFRAARAGHALHVQCVRDARRPRIQQAGVRDGGGDRGMPAVQEPPPHRRPPRVFWRQGARAPTQGLWGLVGEVLLLGLGPGPTRSPARPHARLHVRRALWRTLWLPRAGGWWRPSWRTARCS